MRLTRTTFPTLDGVMQAPGPDEDRTGGFEHGGRPVPHAAEGRARFLTDTCARIDAFLLGRRTYEIFAAHRPRVTDPADPDRRPAQRAAPPRRLDHPDRGEPEGGGADQRRRPGRRRGAQPAPGPGAAGPRQRPLARTPIEAGLVDEHRLRIHPVVLGRGQRPCGGGVTPSALELVESGTTGTGVTMQVYRPAGAPRTGSFPLDA